MGKFGGGVGDMGMWKYLAQRSRSMLIHLSLSVGGGGVIHCCKVRSLDLLLMFRGAVLPHDFIRPPRRMGM